MKRSSMLLALAAVFLSATASAELVTYDFTAVSHGRFDWSEDTSLHLPPGFDEGAIAAGFITFDTSAADADAEPIRGFYPSAIVEFQVTIDGWVFDYDATLPGAWSRAQVRDRTEELGDTMSFAAINGFSAFATPVGSPYSFTVGLQIDPWLRMQFAGDGLIADLTTIPAWWLTWTVESSATTDNVASGCTAQVTSLVQRPASVPEPSAAVLLLTGMLGLAARRKRASR